MAPITPYTNPPNGFASTSSAAPSRCASFHRPTIGEAFVIGLAITHVPELQDESVAELERSFVDILLHGGHRVGSLIIREGY